MKQKRTGERLQRGVLVAAGSLSVGVGVVGVFVPILPTTPFLLLAAACFLRSSNRLHTWLLTNRLFGEYIRRYRDGEGMSPASKVGTLIFLWVSLTISTFMLAPGMAWWVKVILLLVGIGVSSHILTIKSR